MCLTTLLNVVTFSHAASTLMNLPAAPLPQALQQLADIAQIQITYDPDLVSNQRAPALNGTYTPNEALAHLLAASQLRVQEASPGRYHLVQKASADEQQPVKLPEVKVTGEVKADALGNPSYTRSTASTATRTNTPLIKTPISVQVIPRAVIEDQQAIQIEDAIKNVSGVFPGFTFWGLSEEFMIRGFNTSYISYRDGFRFPGARLSLANIERVEVVKGAAAICTAALSLGG
jgi:iron complex outermembrane receptor protein